jgi:outer membrane protein OmpA-like peptidoglycan-associated protein/outer membrane protein W
MQHNTIELNYNIISGRLKMQRLLIVLLLSFGLVQIGLSQNSNEIKVRNSLSGVIVLTGEGGITIGQTDYAEIKPGYTGRGSFEYFFASNLALKISGGIGTVAGRSTFLGSGELRTLYYSVGAGLTIQFPISDVVYPYVSIGVVHMWVTPRDNNGVDLLPGPNGPNFKILGFNGEAGLRFMVSDYVSFNVIGGLMTPFKDDNSDNVDASTRGEHNDWIGSVTLGLSYYIGRDQDTDGDGVYDTKDMCPNTPFEVMVDEFGCPLDADADGVPDYLDKCPNTPTGVKVDASGCPLDADGDGIPDYLDKCSSTPAGVNVDNNGCPIDSDKDGVADYLDKCPNTPANVSVDAKGCPLDSDGDGVPDYLDKCPNTEAGVKVDANGCPIEKVVVMKEVMSSDASFDFNKSALKSQAYGKLDKIVATLKNNPDYSVSIEGYTDAIGSEEYNLKLSERRAQSVGDYIMSQGIAKTRLEIIPLGESNPIASNKTAVGRSKNRRVEIIIKK